MRRFSWLITLPVAVLVVLFTVGNLEPVIVKLWPLPWIVEAPLYLLVLVCLLIGFILGGGVAWLSGGRRRRQARELAERNAALRRELEAARREQAAAAARPAAIDSSRAIASH